MTLKKIRPILLLEINEVPWRVVDHYSCLPAYPNLARFFRQCAQFTTQAENMPELSPWITWPSLHRGSTVQDHQIRFLGQDPSTFRGRTIWEEYRAQGASVGICGSLQSWPARDPGPGGFYIPDTFARDERCIPDAVNAFQALNLSLTQGSARVAHNRLPLTGAALKFLVRAPALGVRFSTAAALAWQVLLERIDPSRAARRPIFQARLLWDIFRRQYKAEAPPAFSTFFTNHVANIMHRYWSHIFPGDFGHEPAEGPHAATMAHAMELLDCMLGEALELQRKNPEILLAFASSMGQSAKEWDNYEGVSAFVQDPHQLIRSLLPELPRDAYSRSMAMVPQLTLTIEDGAARAALTESLEQTRTVSGQRLFFVEGNGHQLSISLRTPSRKDIAAGGFLAGTKEAQQIVAWEKAGIRIEEAGPASAYHIPEGIFALRGEGVAPKSGRQSIPLSQVKSRLLELSGLGEQITSQCNAGPISPGSNARPVEASITS